MSGSYAGNAATFLIQTLFGIYILLVMLRFLLQLVRADFYNQLSQLIIRATNPPLVRLRRFVPGVAGLDMSAVALMLVLQFVELWLTYRVGGMAPNATGLLLLSAAELLALAINVFFFSILIQVILSWINPGAYNPVSSLLHSLNEPLLGPARRLLPPLSGLDLSPLVVLIALQLGSMLVIAPVTDIARGFL